MTKHPKNLVFCAAVMLLVSVPTVPTVSQDIKHAPTLESCVADLNLWVSQIPSFRDPNIDQIRSGMKSLTVREIEGRALSLGECSQAYPVLEKSQAGELSAIGTLTTYYSTEIQVRYFHFILRHNMLDKFRAEDSAGER